MPLKVQKRSANHAPLTIEEKWVPLTPRYSEFHRGWRQNTEVKCYSFIKAWYEKTFGVLPPEQPLALLRTKIEYELLIQDWKESKFQIPPKIRKNWEASRDFILYELSDMVSRSVQAEILAEGGIENMIKQKAKVVKIEAKAAKKAMPRLTVDGEWLRLLQSNFGAKHPDEALAKEMRSFFPKKKAYAVSDVRRARTVYNAGQLGPQKGLSGPRSVSYDKPTATAVVKRIIGKTYKPIRLAKKKK